MHRRVGDVRDVGQRLEWLTGCFAVLQINRQKFDLPTQPRANRLRR
jgi:hypothetical protein